jgi:hypothetical protein
LSSALAVIASRSGQRPKHDAEVAARSATEPRSWKRRPKTANSRETAVNFESDMRDKFATKNESAPSEARRFALIQICNLQSAID